MATIDTVIHQPIRLRIMAALNAVNPGDQFDFSYLRDVLDVTDGNLGAHLIRLEDAGYIVCDKAFIGRKPKTFISISTAGRVAFETYVADLKNIIGDADS